VLNESPDGAREDETEEEKDGLRAPASVVVLTEVLRGLELFAAGALGLDVSPARSARVFRIFEGGSEAFRS
jgi:hypothetical protein